MIYPTNTEQCYITAPAFSCDSTNLWFLSCHSVSSQPALMFSRMTRTRGTIQTPTLVAKVTCSSQSFPPTPFFFSFPLTPLYWMVNFLRLRGYCLCSEAVFLRCLYCLHALCHHSAAFKVKGMSKGMRRNLKGSQLQRQARACEKTKRTHHSIIGRRTILVVGSRSS